MSYYYKAGSVPGECIIDRISWGSNSSAQQQDFATVTFNYAEPDLCEGVPVGSQYNYTSGKQIVSGASKIESIAVTAYSPNAPATPVHTRLITLQYSAEARSCDANHAPYRALVSIQQSAWGQDSPRVDLPPITFDYGNANVLYPVTPTQKAIPWDATGPGALAYNLAWRYRFEGGRWPSIEAMMLDIDGDGLPDRVTNDPVRDAGGHVVSCRARWEKNLGPGHDSFDSQIRYIPLPTFKWASNTTALPPAEPNLYSGGAFAGENRTTGEDESCALNYQISGFSNSHYSGPGCNDNSTCTYGDDANVKHCANGDDCNGRNASAPTYFSYRWIDIDADGLIDLVVSPSVGSTSLYNLQQGNGYNAGTGYIYPEPEPSLGLSFPECPDISTSAGSPAYSMCGGMIPWFVYRNHGGGNFGILDGFPYADEVTYEPVALDGEAADSSIDGPPVGQQRALVDFDNDGRLDAVVGGGSDAVWGVYRNTPTAVALHHNRFRPTELDGQSSPFSVRISTSQSPEHFINFYDPSNGGNVLGILDLNGDGLPDRWAGPDASQGGYVPNYGSSLTTTGLHLTMRPGEDADDSVACQPLEPSCQCATATGECIEGNIILVGTRLEKNRTLDLDFDGRTDVARLENPFNAMLAHFNVGGQFSEGLGIGFPTAALRRRIEVSDQFGISSAEPYTWELRSDMIDIDGDGVYEGMDFGAGRINPATLTMTHISTAPAYRLMTSIDNGRGATTVISYAAATQSNIVKMDAEAIPDAGEPSRPAVVPHPLYVVSSLVTSDSIANTADTNTYSYARPQYLPDDFGRYRFRGFSETDSTNVSGSKTQALYNYLLDWNGTKVMEVRFSGDDLVNPASIESTTFEKLEIASAGDTSLKYYVPSLQEHFLCANAQPRTACISSPSAYSRTTSVFTLETVPGFAGAWLESATRREGMDDLARESVFTHHIHSPDPDTYRIREVSRIDEVIDLITGVGVQYSGMSHQWDPTYAVPLTDEPYYPAASTGAPVRRAYDMRTGNLQKTWKPNQNIAGTAASQNLYDDRELFVAQEINELGMSRGYRYEYGTGAILETSGPNAPDCAATATCRSDQEVSQRELTRVDGLGRVLTKSQTVSNDFLLVTVSQATYTDGTPSFVDDYSIVDTESGVAQYAHTRATHSGTGLMTSKTTYSAESSVPDAVVAYTYTNSGHLAKVSLPDPTDAAVQQSYTYGYDGLDRPSSIRRPDTSGIVIDYNGAVQTYSEIPGSNGGHQIVRAAMLDSFGRIAATAELKNSDLSCLAYPCSTGDNWAMTTYTYDPHDLVSSIRDDNGVTTTFSYDELGRRTSVTRPNNRSWRYGYDLNGNLIYVSTPCVGVACLRTTSTIAYDDLDRPTSRMYSSSGYAAGDADLFGTTDVYSYDLGSNQQGRLTAWISYGPTSPTPLVVNAFTYDAQGNVSSYVDLFQAVGFSNTQIETSSYTPARQLKRIEYNDAGFDCTTSQGTHSDFSYNGRGQMSSLSVTSCESAAPSVTAYAYNAASLLVTANSTLGSAPAARMSNTYDALGRLTGREVRAGSSQATVWSENGTFDGTDDLIAATHLNSGRLYKFSYGYDQQHHLLSVTEDNGLYTAGNTVDGTGRLTHSSIVASPLPGSNVQDRDVSYTYAGLDPEAVTNLTASAGVVATITYDMAGNMTSRAQDGGMLTMMYDGLDRLRRSVRTTPQGQSTVEEYFYGYSGNRTAVVEKDSGGSVVSVRLFHQFGDVLLDSVGGLIETRAYAKGSGNSVAVVRNAAGTRSQLEYVGMNQSTTLIIDQSTGDSKDTFEYSPWGELIASNDTSGQRYRMNGKYQDSTTQMIYYGRRYYDPVVMAWTQSDPALQSREASPLMGAGVWNAYEFSYGNPNRYLDPDGAEVVLRTSNVKKVEEVVNKLSGAMQKFGTVGFKNINSPLGSGYAVTFDLKKGVEPGQAASLLKRVVDDKRIVVVDNLTPSSAADNVERESDHWEAQWKDVNHSDLYGHGGASTADASSAPAGEFYEFQGKPVQDLVLIDFDYVENNSVPGEHGSSVKETGGSALLHELWHVTDWWDEKHSDTSEDRARTFENNFIRVLFKELEYNKRSTKENP